MMALRRRRPGAPNQRPPTFWAKVHAYKVYPPSTHHRRIKQLRDPRKNRSLLLSRSHNPPLACRLITLLPPQVKLLTLRPQGGPAKGANKSQARRRPCITRGVGVVPATKHKMVVVAAAHTRFCARTTLDVVIPRPDGAWRVPAFWVCNHTTLCCFPPETSATPSGPRASGYSTN